MNGPLSCLHCDNHYLLLQDLEDSDIAEDKDGHKMQKAANTHSSPLYLCKFKVPPVSRRGWSDPKIKINGMRHN